MHPRTQAQDAASWYFSHLDPFSPNSDNIRTYLRGPLLAVTVHILQSSPLDQPAAAATAAVEEEKKSAAADSWRDYLQATRPSYVWNDKGQDAYDSLSRRTKARMQAFLAGCTIAVPSELSQEEQLSNDSPITAMRKKQQIVSLQEGLLGFGISKIGKKDLFRSKQQPSQSSQRSSILSVTEQGKSLMLQISKPPSMKHPQIKEEDLVLRLELYIRTMQRVKTLNEDCVIAMEPPKAVKARARYVTHAFVATAGCVRSMSPVLTRLLNCLTMEMLAVDTLSEEIGKVVKRCVSEYEHGTSFASLAFLSTPEVNADSLLTPLVLKYLRYLQSDWECLIQECALERMLSQALDPSLRRTFKTIEFRSIGHLLEVCNEYRSKLHNIVLAPNVCAVAENVNTLCHSTVALKQALRDLQREVITVNGHVLPPVTSRKELLHLLSQTLNSRTLTAAPPKPPKRKGKSPRRYESAKSQLPDSNHSKTSDEDKKPPANHINNSDGSDFLFSSECDSSDTDLPDLAIDSPVSQDRNKKSLMSAVPKRNRRRNFHLSTIDMLTRRLLIAASRTGNGGDAYFMV
jgi:hypothetical protein